MDLNGYLSKQSSIINGALAGCYRGNRSLLGKAMRYSLLAGGKRLRPLLVMEGAKVAGGDPRAVLPAACAVEMIHAYSLIHDDLPAMDDDDLRRGRPTNHRVFGEAIAILSGDALLTDAFGLIGRCAESGSVKPVNALHAVALLAEAAGSGGMVGGQAADTAEEGAWRKKSRRSVLAKLEYIHSHKTAALIRASLLVGATLAGASRRQLNALGIYGENIGLAFQVSDDILDLTADKKLLGKRGSDRDNGKLTYPAMHGIAASRKIAHGLVKDAKRPLAIFGEKAAVLRSLADHIVERAY